MVLVLDTWLMSVSSSPAVAVAECSEELTGKLSGSIFSWLYLFPFKSVCFCVLLYSIVSLVSPSLLNLG